MEFPSVVQFLENKSIFVTGVTGFLAKLFVEKILRVQPNVKKLYLLLRAADATSANNRFQNEVIEKELFRVAKAKFGASLSSLISKKITVICGDVSFHDLGIKDSSLVQEMKNELDLILNFAATTTFDERYDVAFGTNTMGANNVLCFAKSCKKLKLLSHISTAYVCGEKSGVILEKPYGLNETLNGIVGLNIEKEKILIDQKLDELLAQGATEITIKETMKDLGSQRAKLYGWPNTYVFTKAMGEMVLGHFKENLPVVIIRPTMVTSTYKEPFPGWIEGARTIDALTVGYGRGKLTFFVVDLAAIVDVIPADMVVNAIILAMAAHANQAYDNFIYHVGSSLRNPIKYSNFEDYLYQYFTKNPCIGKNGKSIKISKILILKNMSQFHRYVALRYSPLLKGLKLANTLSCHYLQSKYNTANRKIKFAKRLVELYKPYLFFQGIFDDSSTEKLWILAKKNCVESNVFFLDIESIDWEEYFMNIHIPGIVKYVIRP